jgi:DNA-binding helix-hairpin-helix protein with protein kinase domain
MSYEVTQWLAEIKALKEQIAELQKDRDAAWESAETWRQLYNTEAQQRREEAKHSQDTIASLKTEIQHRDDLPSLPYTDEVYEATVHHEMEELESLEELKAKLLAVLNERDRLLLALQTEQHNHAQTRRSLTTALGDAIDRLTRDRVAQNRRGELGGGEEGR